MQAPGKAVILIVEEDPDVRGVMADILLTDGYEVAMAANVREARGVLADMEPPGLLFLDLTRPSADAEPFLRQLREDATHSEVPVVAISAEPGPRPPGVVTVLRKPVRVGELMAAVERHCRRR